MNSAATSSSQERSDKISLWNESGALRFKAPRGTYSAELRSLVNAEREALLALLADGRTLGARESLVLVFERRRRAWIADVRQRDAATGPTVEEVLRRVAELRNGAGWDPLLAWYRVHAELVGGHPPEEADKLTTAWRRATATPDEEETEFAIVEEEAVVEAWSVIADLGSDGASVVKAVVERWRPSSTDTYRGRHNTDLSKCWCQRAAKRRARERQALAVEFGSRLGEFGRFAYRRGADMQAAALREMGIGATVAPAPRASWQDWQQALDAMPLPPWVVEWDASEQAIACRAHELAIARAARLTPAAQQGGRP